jgi:hypothetical protein
MKPSGVKETFMFQSQILFETETASAKLRPSSFLHFLVPMYSTLKKNAIIWYTFRPDVNIHTFLFTICPLRGPAHQIRFAWKWYGSMGLGKNK